MRRNFSRSASINHKHKLLYSLMYVYCTFVQYTTHLQVITYNSLLRGQRIMHRGLLNKKSLGPFWPVRPAGLDFQARPCPACWRPGSLPSLVLNTLRKHISTVTALVNFLCSVQCSMHNCSASVFTIRYLFLLFFRLLSMFR